jgi:hypothetical protein
MGRVYRKDSRISITLVAEFLLDIPDDQVIGKAVPVAEPPELGVGYGRIRDAADAPTPS